MSFRLKSLKLRRERAGRFKDTNESGGGGTRSVPGTPPLERAKTVATGLGQGCRQRTTEPSCGREQSEQSQIYHFGLE